MALERPMAGASIEKKEVVYMDLIVRMKTGFFEKAEYRLEASDDGLTLTTAAAESAERIDINEKDILSASLREGRLPELELQTRDALYQAVFGEGISFEEVLSFLKKHLSVNITCEYKGGKKNALETRRKEK